MFVVLTIPPDMARMTVNMKAPVVINLDKGTAVQMVLADRSYEVRVPAHEAFTKAVANYTLSLSADRGFSEVEEDDSWNPVSVKKGAGHERSVPTQA